MYTHKSARRNKYYKEVVKAWKNYFTIFKMYFLLFKTIYKY